MQISLNSKFRKKYKKRIIPGSNLDKKYRERVEIFSVNPQNPVIKDHALAGKFMGFRAFSITGDYRVVYFLEDENTAIFVDIGNHNQVYS